MTSSPSHDSNDNDDTRGFGNKHRGRKPITFTREELDVIRECNSESFYYRCLPLSLAGYAGVKYLTNIGKLKPHPKYGTLFKTIGVVIFGFFAGKISYRNTCKQKILERVPNSRLAKAVSGQGAMDIFQEMSAPPELPSLGQKFNEPLREEYSSFDLNDTPTNKEHNELDDNFRPTLDREVKNHDSTDTAQQKVSYEELRQKNRAEFDKKLQPPPTDAKETITVNRPPPRRQTPIQDSGKPKNKYGDTWDE